MVMSRDAGFRFRKFLFFVRSDGEDSKPGKISIRKKKNFKSFRQDLRQISDAFGYTFDPCSYSDHDLVSVKFYCKRTFGRGNLTLV